MPRTQNLRAEPDRVQGWREGWLPVMVHFTVTFTGPEGAQPLGLRAFFFEFVSEGISGRD